MTTLVLFPLLFQTQRGSGANLNELLKWFNYAGEAAQWRSTAATFDIATPYTYGIPLSRALNALIADGSKAISAKELFDSISPHEQRPEGSEGAFVLAFRAGDKVPERTVNLSSRLSKALLDAHQVNEIPPPLYLAVGEGNAQRPTTCQETHQSILLALALARESNSLAMIALIRLYRQVASAVEDPDTESTVKSTASYHRFFCHLQISFVNEGDNPATMDFYLFADSASLEETVSTFEGMVLAVIQGGGVTTAQKSILEGNFFPHLWHIPLAH